MTAMPWPPSYDFRAPYAGDAPYVRDTMNPYRTSPSVPQNLLRVTRRGADDRPTPEESVIMSSFGMQGVGAVSPIVASRLRGVLAGLGRGGHGGHHHGGHHHRGGGGRGGWWGGAGYGGWDYGGDTIIYMETPECPYGSAWDAYRQRCVRVPVGFRGAGTNAVVMSPPDGMHGLGATAIEQRVGRARYAHQSHVASMRVPTGGGSRPGYTAMRRDLRLYRDAAHAMPALGGLRAGAYMGAVGSEIEAPSVSGAALRGQVQSVVLSGAGIGTLPNTCTDAGWRTAGDVAGIIGGLVQTGAQLYGQSAQSQGTIADAGRVSQAAGTTATGLTQAFTSMCAATSQNTGQTTPPTMTADQMLAQMKAAGLLPGGGSSAPVTQPTPMGPAPMSTTTKVAIGGGALVVGLLALKFFL